MCLAAQGHEVQIGLEHLVVRPRIGEVLRRAQPGWTTTALAAEHGFEAEQRILLAAHRRQFAATDMISGWAIGLR